MDLRHQSSAVCIIMLGKVRNPIPATIPVTKKTTNKLLKPATMQSTGKVFLKLLCYKPSRSTLLPQGHVCAKQMLTPRRKPIEILSCWSSSFRPRFLQGTTFSHWGWAEIGRRNGIEKQSKSSGRHTKFLNGLMNPLLWIDLILLWFCS